MSTPARVLVADDHAPTREDVRVAVEADPRAQGMVPSTKGSL